jgi:hypothetical protein
VAVVEAHAEVVAGVHHEDEADLATAVDAEDPEEDSAVAAVEAVASQEVEVAVVSRVVVAVVVASADADVEATRVTIRLLWSFKRRASECAARLSILSFSGDHIECHDYYQPIPRSSFDGVWELRWVSCKRSDTAPCWTLFKKAARDMYSIQSVSSEKTTDCTLWKYSKTRMSF